MLQSKAGVRAVLVASALLVGGCAPKSEVDPEVRAAAQIVEEKAGPFLDYYAQVVDLAHRHRAEPDSFRIGLEALPGTQLSEAEWKAWTAPYEQDPQPLVTRLEEMIAGLSSRRQ